MSDVAEHPVGRAGSAPATRGERHRLGAADAVGVDPVVAGLPPRLGERLARTARRAGPAPGRRDRAAIMRTLLADGEGDEVGGASRSARERRRHAVAADRRHRPGPARSPAAAARRSRTPELAQRRDVGAGADQHAEVAVDEPVEVADLLRLLGGQRDAAVRGEDGDEPQRLQVLVGGEVEDAWARRRRRRCRPRCRARRRSSGRASVGSEAPRTPPGPSATAIARAVAANSLHAPGLDGRGAGRRRSERSRRLLGSRSLLA